LKISNIVINDTETGNGNNMLDPGEQAEIKIYVINRGHTFSENTKSILTAHSGFVSVDDPEQNLGLITLFGAKIATYQVTVDAQAPEGINADMEFDLQADNTRKIEIHSMKIGLVSEDFETGDLSKFEWQPEGDQPWQIINDYPFEGFFSIKSGNINNNEESGISLQYEVGKHDNISFYRKVSSQDGDKLMFSINGQVKDEWSGTTGGWIRESFAVQPGVNTFEWNYDKNGSGSSGADCGWIDYIMLPQPMVTTLYAGIDDSNCEDEGYQINGQATEYDAVLWETSGSGTFNESTILTPVYTPSEDDITNGQVVLSLKVWGTDELEYIDDLLLTIEASPEAPGTPSGPDYIDLAGTFVSDYDIEPLESVNEYNWEMNPPEAGTFSSDGLSTSIVWNRNYAGEVSISALGLNSCGTGSNSPELIVTVENTFVGLEEVDELNSKLHVYPNPNNGQFSLYLDQNGDTKLNLNLFNIAGQSGCGGSVERIKIDPRRENYDHGSIAPESGDLLPDNTWREYL